MEKSQEGFFILQNIIKGKWKSPLLQYLNAGNKRPKDLLQLCAGISTKVLNEQLKQLTQDGLITRLVYPNEIPIKVEYALTLYGQEFIPLLEQLCEFGVSHGKKFQLPIKEPDYLQDR